VSDVLMRPCFRQPKLDKRQKEKKAKEFARFNALAVVKSFQTAAQLERVPL
jgi:hypothetical protein